MKQRFFFLGVHCSLAPVRVLLVITGWFDFRDHSVDLSGQVYPSVRSGLSGPLIPATPALCDMRRPPRYGRIWLGMQRGAASPSQPVR